MVPLMLPTWNPAVEEKPSFSAKRALGFFYKPLTDDLGVCRLRTAHVCDYGMQVTRPIRNAEVTLSVNGQAYKVRTDHEGRTDFTFNCSKNLHEKSASISLGKYEAKFILSEVQKEHVLNEQQCD